MTAQIQKTKVAEANAKANDATDANLHTIIAALRYWQQNGMGDPFNRSDDLHELATNGGEVLSSLDDQGIDELVVALNFGAISLQCEGVAAEPTPLPAVVIEVEGGVVQCVRSSVPMRAIVLDADTEGGDPDSIVEVAGVSRYVSDYSLSEETDGGFDGVDNGFCESVISQLAAS